MLGGFKLSRSYQTKLSFSRSISPYAEQLLKLFSLQNGMFTQPIRSFAVAVWATHTVHLLPQRWHGREQSWGVNRHRTQPHHCNLQITTHTHRVKRKRRKIAVRPLVIAHLVGNAWHHGRPGGSRGGGGNPPSLQCNLLVALTVS